MKIIVVVAFMAVLLMVSEPAEGITKCTKQTYTCEFDIIPDCRPRSKHARLCKKYGTCKIEVTKCDKLFYPDINLRNECSGVGAGVTVKKRCRKQRETTTKKNSGEKLIPV